MTSMINIYITYNHLFRKPGFDRLYPASKFAQDLKDNHYRFK